MGIGPVILFTRRLNWGLGWRHSRSERGATRSNTYACFYYMRRAKKRHFPMGGVSQGPANPGEVQAAKTRAGISNTFRGST